MTRCQFYMVLCSCVFNVLLLFVTFQLTKEGRVKTSTRETKPHRNEEFIITINETTQPLNDSFANNNFTEKESKESPRLSNSSDEVKAKIPGILDPFLSVELMKKLPKRRELFNFTLTPWKVKVDSPRSSMLQKSVIDPRWSMIIIVKSHPDHEIRRKIARWTWASYEVVDGVRLETIFVIGRAPSETARKSLDEESKKYGDILQIDVEDIYRNVGYKTLAGMQWIVQHYPSEWMYSSVDDDMMPDLVRFIENVDHLRNSRKKAEESMEKWIGGSTKSFIDSYMPIFCGFGYAQYPPPKRQTGNKWAIDLKMYPLEFYPPYCFGGWYTMSVALLPKLYDISRGVPFFWIDDVWITGFLRVKLLDDLNLNCEKCDISEGLWTNTSIYYTISTTGDEEKLMKIWNTLVSKITQTVHALGESD